PVQYVADQGWVGRPVGAVARAEAEGPGGRRSALGPLRRASGRQAADPFHISDAHDSAHVGEVGEAELVEAHHDAVVRADDTQVDDLLRERLTRLDANKRKGLLVPNARV